MSRSTSKKLQKFTWVTMFFGTVLLVYYLMFSSKSLFGRNEQNSYALYNLRNENYQREAIINELRRDFAKIESKIEHFYSKTYRRRSETAHVDCGRILSGDKDYLQTVSGENRIPMVENPNPDMSCSAVMDRIIPHDHILRPLKNGVAFARIVYKDYELVEKQVQMSYHPQNSFCFAIDKKAPTRFKNQMRAMAACLPNVLLLPDQEPIDSNGHNVNLAHLNCLRALINKPGWNYAMLLQNHDLLTKSVYELEQVYEWLGGANDVELLPEAQRLDEENFKWDPRSLKMFPDESKVDETILNEKIKFSKGGVQGSMSRAAVDWMTRKVNLSTYIDQWNQGRWGVDEMLISSLQISAFLGMPGHFTDQCLKEGKVTDFITRMVQWNFEDESYCASKYKRHNVCILGIEYLRSVASFPTLMFNKMLPPFDNSIIECTAELLYNRTFMGQNDHPLEEEYYKNMVTVLYHKHHKEHNYTLNCDPKYTSWQTRQLPL